MPTIKVELRERSYPIVVGSGIPHRLKGELGKHVGDSRLFVFYDARFYALHGRDIREIFKSAAAVTEFVVPSGEKAKSSAVLSRIYAYLLSEKISRSDFVLACGGGVTSDLIGYAAATVLRGIRWGVVPTTLLGMVDAAIGGKTGINHVEGKNLIGAVWQPKFVLCDTRYLMTLPRREMIAGLGEVVKYGGLVGKPMTDLLVKFLNNNELCDEKILVRLIALSAEYKAALVALDERESGPRMWLNLGHTFGHGIEAALGYRRLRHGEAVILGLYAACDLSERVRMRIDKRSEDYRSIVKRLIRFVPYRKIDPGKVLRALATDKKRAGLRARFVLLDRPGKPFVADRVSSALVKKSISTMLDCYQAFGGKDA